MNAGSEYKSSTFQAVLKYFRVAMAFVYIALGIAILWKSDQLINLPSTYSIPLGCILIGYGIIRGYRTIQREN